MNTKTMRLPPRRVLTSHKRKDRDEGFDTLKPSPPAPPAPPAPPPPPPTPKTKSPKPMTTTTLQHRLGSRNQQSEPAPSNQLLAGYLAHEYLTKGTLFGQPWWDPVRAEAVSPSSRRKAKEAEPNNSHNNKTDLNQNYQRYVEVSNLLKAKGTHLPGVVNPSQLAHLLQM